MNLKETMEAWIAVITNSPAAFVAASILAKRLPDYSSAEAADYMYIMGE